MKISKLLVFVFLAFSFSSCQKEDFKNEGERWDHILSNLPKIKEGMKKEKVIKILGNPDGLEYCPKNTIQYSVASDFRPQGNEGKYIRMVFSDAGILQEIQRVDGVYGPPPG